jgi:hypothetical protein
VSCPWRTPATSFLPSRGREDPWSCPRTPQRRPPFPSLSPRFPPSRALLPVTDLDRHGRHLGPSSRAPCSTELLRRLPSTSSVSTPKESSQNAQNSRHRRRFTRRRPKPRSPNSSSPANLRPRRPPWRFPDESPDRPDPSPRLAARRFTGHGRPSPEPGSRSGWASAPADLTSVACCWPSGPSGQLLWVNLTRCKKDFPESVSFQKNVRNVKLIVIYLYVRKMHMIYRNAQKNMLYMFMSNSCMFIQLEPLPK